MYVGPRHKISTYVTSGAVISTPGQKQANSIKPIEEIENEKDLY